MPRPTHRQTRTPLYRAWRNMIGRCYYPRSDRFANYGGRGIKVCPEWRHDFAAFARHVGPRPSPQHTIERRDVNGDYEPGNVCWATKAEQARNRTTNIRVTVAGVTRTVADWARLHGLSPFTVYNRIDDLGWDPVDAVTRPAGNQGRHRRA